MRHLLGKIQSRVLKADQEFDGLYNELLLEMARNQVDENRGNVLAQVLFKVVAQPVLLVNGKLTFVNQELKLALAASAGQNPVPRAESRSGI
jgi:hypothetical protein